MIPAISVRVHEGIERAGLSVRDDSVLRTEHYQLWLELLQGATIHPLIPRRRHLDRLYESADHNALQLIPSDDSLRA